MNIGNKIKLYILLISFLSVSFPIQEFFHNHNSGEECIINHNHEENEDHEKISKKTKQCTHKTHVSEKKEQDFCFLLHISKSFYTTITNYTQVIKLSFEALFIQSFQKVYFSNISTQYLRGPPLLF